MEEKLLSKDDFDSKELQKILSNVKEIGYYPMQREFELASAKAREIKDTKKEKIYGLFAIACSMCMKSEMAADPFVPQFVFETKRARAVQDLTWEQVDFFSKIVYDINNPYLQARLADIVWIRQRHQKYAKLAIKAYHKITFEDPHDSFNCWHRAVTLTEIIKDNKTPLELKSTAITELDSKTKLDGQDAWSFSELLFRLPLDKKEEESVAKKYQNLAEEFQESGNIDNARLYFEKAFQWYNHLDEKNKSHEMIIAQADMIEERARAVADEGRGSLANSWYEDTIQKLREIPSYARKNFKVNERIENLRVELSESAASIYSEMATITTTVSLEDSREQIEAIVKEVQGKEPIDALCEFANISSFINYDEMKANAIDMVRDSIMWHCYVTHLSRDGRVVQKTEGLNLNKNSIEDEPQVHSAIMMNYKFHVQFVAKYYIVPALMLIQSEHNFREKDFLIMSRESPIVPQYHEEIFAKGLFAGYNRDFVTSMHILPPHLEALIRYHLKHKRVLTTALDNDGIETEMGLKSLLEKKETEKIFGKDAIFEIKALFCDPLGANIRNNIAHGLANQNEIGTTHDIYAWWFMFKLIFNTYFMRLQESKDTEGKE